MPQAVAGRQDFFLGLFCSGVAWAISSSGLLSLHIFHEEKQLANLCNVGCEMR